MKSTLVPVQAASCRDAIVAGSRSHKGDPSQGGLVRDGGIC